MIVKEMATELYNKFYDTSHHSNSVEVRNEVAVKSAITCVDEILRACNQVYDSDMVHFKETATGEWWAAVKNELENLRNKKKPYLEICGFCRGKRSVRSGAYIHESCRHCNGSGYRVVV